MKFRCPYDGGFDREIGPIGCQLVGEGRECVCLGIYTHQKTEKVADAPAVTQADREAAAYFLCPSAGGWFAARKKQHASDNETMEALAEAFAHHRIAAEARKMGA